MHLFGSKKNAAPAPPPAPTEPAPYEGELKLHLTQKEIEIYPLAVKLFVEGRLKMEGRKVVIRRK